MQDRWKDERASKNQEREEMHGDDPCIHPSTADIMQITEIIQPTTGFCN